MAPGAVTHVIFDMDGLILDTERLYSKIMQEICGKHGHQFNWDVKVKQMGKKEREAAKVLIDYFNLPITVEEYIETNHRLQEELFPHAELLPGAEKLIRHLHKHKVPICIATGSDSKGFKLKTSGHHDLFGLFLHTVLSSEDPEVVHGKPAPDCFLVAANRFDPNPDTSAKVLVFEDAPNGVEGALAAGMQCVWVPDPNVDRSNLQDKATVVLNSLEEFRPETFGLPPYNS